MKNSTAYTRPPGYFGDVVDGQPHGKGVSTNYCGEIYQGEYLKGKKHGNGILISANNQSYRGLWQDGLRHDEGILTSSDQKIVAEVIYEQDKLKEVKSVSITDSLGSHKFEFKSSGECVYISPEGKEYEIDEKNKRILEVLKQFGNPLVNPLPDIDDIIQCDTAEEFKSQLNNLCEQSKTDSNAIVKRFHVPGHVFVLVFESGEIFCCDNGGLNNKKMKEFFSVLQLSEFNVSYDRFFLSENIAFLAKDTKDSIELQFSVSIKKDSFNCCRYIANVISQKLSELIKECNQGGSLIDKFLEYLNSIEEGMPSQSAKPISQTTVLRANSFQI